MSARGGAAVRVPLDYHPGVARRVLARADPLLAPVIARAGAVRLHHRQPLSPFAALLGAIVSQQLSGRAASTIHARLCALFPGARPGPRRLLALPDEALRAAGLSRPKIAAARALAIATIDGLVPARGRLARMDDEAIVERLTRVRGIGRWTVEMLLIFQLGRGDVLPVDDLGIRKGFARVSGGDALPERAALSEHAERWRPYRSVASWYLWRATEL